MLSEETEVAQTIERKYLHKKYLDTVDVSLRSVELEQCNRGCVHCGTVAKKPCLVLISKSGLNGPKKCDFIKR